MIDYSFNYFQLRFVKGGKNRVAFRFVSNSSDSNLNEKREENIEKPLGLITDCGHSNICWEIWMHFEFLVAAGIRKEKNNKFKK